MNLIASLIELKINETLEELGHNESDFLVSCYLTSPSFPQMSTGESFARLNTQLRVMGEIPGGMATLDAALKKIKECLPKAHPVDETPERKLVYCQVNGYMPIDSAGNPASVFLEKIKIIPSGGSVFFKFNIEVMGLKRVI